MKFRKSLQMAWNMLLHSPLRSWLTIIGIVIGISSVVSIISMSMGAQQQLSSRLGSLGADILTITPGRQRASGTSFNMRISPPDQGAERNFPSTFATSSVTKNLTERDISAIRGLPNVKYVMGQISGRTNLTFLGNTAKNIQVIGVETSVWKDITTSTLSSGRYLTNGDSSSAVIGSQIANSVFGKAVTLNSKIYVGGKAFTVVGILSEGSTVYIPIDSARTIIEDKNNPYFDSILVKIADTSLTNDTITQITNRLMLTHGILNPNKIDFSISNPASMQQTIQSTMRTMTLFLGAIAAISLLVGAVGIANTMFTSTLEKMREIGVLKALGAKNIDILLIFLLNSALIGLVGGIGGVILGSAASIFINDYAGISAGGNGMLRFFGSSIISLPLILGAILIAVAVGVIAGVIPAYRASKLDPVEALKYE
ncbi:MAG: ABC transporter permease [Candidatus Woesearchaeota archaeon]